MPDIYRSVLQQPDQVDVMAVFILQIWTLRQREAACPRPPASMPAWVVWLKPYLLHHASFRQLGPPEGKLTPNRCQDAATVDVCKGKFGDG